MYLIDKLNDEHLLVPASEYHNKNLPKEPIIHSLITDCLTDDHPLAHEEVFCQKCGDMVHCFNNECMTMWVESFVKFDNSKDYEYSIHCFECYVMKVYGIEEKDRPVWLKFSTTVSNQKTNI